MFKGKFKLLVVVLLLLVQTSVFAEGQAGLGTVIYGGLCVVILFLTLFLGSLILLIRKLAGGKHSSEKIFFSYFLVFVVLVSVFILNC